MVGVVPGRGWKSVTVPEPLYVRLREVAAKRGVAIWQLLEEMLSFYVGGGGVSCGGDLDRAAYYILKLVYSVSALKINPTTENMEWLEKTLAQLEERLGVDCKNILPAAKKYTDNPTGKNKHTLNMTTKHCIKTIITGTTCSHNGK